ncbi:MAG: hypothetical protein ABI333_18305 [bacterium]
MAVKKFAISVAEDVMTEVDRAAAERGISRSRFITGVLRQVADARKDAEVIRRINELLAGEDLNQQQADEALAFQHAGVTTGTEW